LSAEEQKQTASTTTEHNPSAPSPANPTPKQEPADHQIQETSAKVKGFLERSKQEGRVFWKRLCKLIRQPKTWLEIAAIVVVGIYTHYAKQQVDAMNKTLEEIKKQTPKITESADAAKRAADLGFFQAKGTQAAQVRFSVGFTCDNEAAILVNGSNTGHVTAENVTATLRITRKAWPSKRIVSGPATITLGPQPLPPNSPDSGGFNERFNERVVIPGKDICTAIGNGGQFIMIDWSASYGNGFGDIIRKPEACQSLLYFAPIRLGDATISAGPNFVNCGAYFDSVMEQAVRSRRQVAK
jgi:hypothetical protein